MKIKLARSWTLGQKIGGGGFGQVFEVSSEDQVNAVIKLVHKEPGADRELLFVDLDGIRNVVPIIDSGDAGENWALVMPRADMSLREFLDTRSAPDFAERMKILTDLSISLCDLDGNIVHRDIKPENVLLLDGNWCLADFGISRYAEATTAPDTRKYALSPPYAAPERWRAERASTATDVYSLGVIAYEIFSGSLPYSGPHVDDFRDQHLHADVPDLKGVPPALAALISECLFKAPEARPGPSNLLARLGQLPKQPQSAGLEKLQSANLAEVARRGEDDRRASAQRSQAERRRELFESATKTFGRVSESLREAILGAAPSATVQKSGNLGWIINLGQAELRLVAPAETASEPWGGWEPPAFGVVCHASIGIRFPASRHGYEGRSHSLWYGDIQEVDRYNWFETAFMVSPLMGKQGRQDPFALDPGEESAKAVWAGMAEFQVAWPFSPVIPGELDEFIGRWGGWFAEASNGNLTHPSSMPEKNPNGSWRRG